MKHFDYSALLMALVFSSLISSDAYAYLDPGSGTVILQILLGGVAGLIVIGKLYWHKLLGLFSRKVVEK